jgi:bifunctional non-homologous end joining protein LigD
MMAVKRKTRTSPLTAVRISHPERIVYPVDEITKGELAAYYAAVAQQMLPHIVNRPLTIVRCPAGIDDPCFFQKHPPPGLPKSVDRVPIREKNGVNDYVAVHDAEGLMTLVQFNAMEIHVWGSKTDDVERPDRIVFDLDPGPGVSWRDIVAGAEKLRALLRQLKLAAFVKTTGGKGLHVVTPIRPDREWDEVKEFARALVTIVEQEEPERYVTNMSKAKRTGKIFLDYLRNDRGSTWVAPYSTRARAGAGVSMPVDWRQLSKLKSAAAFTLRNTPRHLATRRGDPWKDLKRSTRALSAAMFRRVGLD